MFHQILIIEILDSFNNFLAQFFVSFAKIIKIQNIPGRNIKMHAEILKYSTARFKNVIENLWLFFEANRICIF